MKKDLATSNSAFANLTAKCLVLSVLLLCPAITYAAGSDSVSVSTDGMIDITIDNAPLNQTLRTLSTKLSIEIKGAPVSSEPMSLALSNISLDELLKRLMRGYNYVLIKDSSNKSVLMVLGKAERTKYTDPPRVAGVTVNANTPAPPPPQPQAVYPGYPQTYNAMSAGPSSAPINQPSQPHPGGSPQAVTYTAGLRQSAGSPAGTSADPSMPPSPTMMGGRAIPPELMPPMPPSMAGTAATSSGQTGVGQQATSQIPPQIPVSTGTSSPSQQTGGTISTGTSPGYVSPSIPTDTTTTASAPQPQPIDIRNLRPPDIPLK